MTFLGIMGIDVPQSMSDGRCVVLPALLGAKMGYFSDF